MHMLEVSGVTKNFGGVHANQDITFNVDKGQIVGLIGPNGAGKTTLFNCLTGTIKADSGKALFLGTDLIGLNPVQVLSLGLARTFQITKTFPTMTVLENVMVGAFFHRKSVKDARDFAFSILEFTKLASLANQLGSELTVAGRKRVEIARALATEPKLIMLDEAMAGLNKSEIIMATQLVRDIRAKDITIILIEHIMEAVLPLSDWVIVMDQGSLLVEGLAKDIVQDERVINAYLGENYAADTK